MYNYANEAWERVRKACGGLKVSPFTQAEICNNIEVVVYAQTVTPLTGWEPMRERSQGGRFSPLGDFK